METLKQIQNQTIDTKLNKLNKFIKQYAKESKVYEADERTLNWLFNEASMKADYATPYKVESGYKLYEVEVEYFGYCESKDDHTHHITVYVAEYLDEKTDEFYQYYAL